MVKLFYDLLSQPSRAVYLFLSRSKLPFQKCPIALRKGEHRTDEYAQINPFQLVPAIDDNGFKLTESIAIYRYLVNSYPDKFSENWYPKDPKKQARIDEYLEWQHANTRISAAMFFQFKFLIPLLTQSPPVESKVQSFRGRLETVLDAFEETWLKGDKPYIAGSTFSLADLVAFTELQQPGIAGFNIFEGHPKLTEWYKRVENDLQPEIQEINTILEKVRTTGNAALSKL